MNNNNNITFIGTRGTVVAIDQNNGDELWRTQLPGSFYAPVTIFFEEGKVFCGSNGKVFILCSKSGRLIAKNDLVGQGFGVVTFTTKRTEVVKQSEQIQHPQLGFQQHPQLMSEQIGNQNHQQEQEQPPMYQPPQQMYQSIPVEQESLYFVQPQSQQSNLPFVSRLFPSLNVQNGVEYQRLLDHFDEDEEYARSLDIELNGNNRNNQRENQRNLYHNNDSYVNNEHNRLMNNPNRLMTLSDLNNSINNHVRRNKKNNNNSLLVSQDFNIFHNNINMYRNNRVQVEISIDDIIFVALNSFITAISKNNAQEVWRTQVPTSYGLPLSIMFTQGKLNIASGGNVYCLNAYTGKELWRNTLPGLGYTNVSIVSNSSQNSNFLSRLHH